MTLREPIDVALTVAGLAALALGAVQPLFRVNPSRPAGAPVPLGYATELGDGVQGLDAALLGAAGVVAVLLVVDWPRWRGLRAGLAAVTGLVAVVTSAHYLLGPSFGVGGAATFVPTLGWYAVVGGGLLLVGGALGSGERLRRRAAAAAIDE